MGPDEIRYILLKYVGKITNTKVERLKNGYFILTYNGQSFYISIKLKRHNRRPLNSKEIFVVSLYSSNKEKLLSFSVYCFYRRRIMIADQILRNIAKKIKKSLDNYIVNGGNEGKSYSTVKIMDDFGHQSFGSDSYIGNSGYFISDLESYYGFDLDVFTRDVLKSDIKKEKQFKSFPVLFGTNREISLSSKEIFNNKRDDQLHLGICNVSIPESHRLGELERPVFFLKESPEKHFTVLDTEIDELAFKELLKEKINNSDENDALLFIHGFNVKFKDAILRTAQLGCDLAFKGAVAAFSWPSQGNVEGYMVDRDTAEVSSDYLRDYIKIILGNENIKKLHIIAHSMGNVVLTKALEKLKEEGLYPNPILKQIILAAPDIDKDIFKQIMPAIRREVPNIILYASNKDKALILSKKIRAGYERLGEGGENIVVMEGLDSIDASKVNTNFLGHGYFVETQSLINEIHMVLLNIPPENRMLESCYNGNGKYWRLKKT